jgi:hypothetical protein
MGTSRYGKLPTPAVSRAYPAVEQTRISSRGRKRRLVIVPHAELHFLSFAALILPGAG